MKMLVVADIHGKYEILRKIMDDAAKETFDVIIAPGDFTDMFDIPPDFTQLDIADLAVQKLMVPNKPLFCVLGNHDPYEINEVFNDYDVNLHNRHRNAGVFDFVGWGGAETPFNTLFEPTEEETAHALGGLVKNIAGKWILVVHAPPKGTKLDRVGHEKHVGSAAVRKTILEKKPLLAISAHIHESPGTDRLGETTLFYPGPAFSGHYGVVTIDESGVRCEAKKVVV